MKTIIILFILGLIISNTKAQDVDIQLATKVAENYFDRNVHNSIKDKYSHDIQRECGYKLKVKKSILKSYKGRPSYYINNMEGGGWVLVSANKKVGPILAYSEFGSYDLDNLPEVISDWMAQFDNIIEKRRLKDTIIVKKVEKWRKYEEDNMLKSGGIFPDYLIKTKWHQAYPYNNAITDSSERMDGYLPAGTKCMAGCSSIAISQIVNYWGFSQGDLADFEFWNMPNSFVTEYGTPIGSKTQKDATSYMIKVIGTDKLHSSYCDGGGVATFANNTEDAFQKIGYDSGVYYDRSWPWLTGYDYWLKKLTDCIDNHMPIDYRFNGKHEFICDGYDVGGNLHFNLGRDDTYTCMWSDFEDLMVPDDPTADYRDIHKHNFFSGIHPIVESSKELINITLNNNDNKTWQVYFGLVAKSVIINSGAKGQFVAGSAVTLLPGFWAKPGSGLTVKAYLNDNLFYSTLKSAQINDNILNPAIPAGTNKMNGVKVFPNPAFGEVTIQTSASGNGTFQLFDLSGKLTLSGSLNSLNTKIPLQNISSGQYVLKVVSDSNDFWFKIIHK